MPSNRPSQCSQNISLSTSLGCEVGSPHKQLSFDTDIFSRRELSVGPVYLPHGYAIPISLIKKKNSLEAKFWKQYMAESFLLRWAKNLNSVWLLFHEMQKI